MRQQRGFRGRFGTWWLRERRAWMADVLDLCPRKRKRYGCCREYAKDDGCGVREPGKPAAAQKLRIHRRQRAGRAPHQQRQHGFQRAIEGQHHPNQAREQGGERYAQAQQLCHLRNLFLRHGETHHGPQHEHGKERVGVCDGIGELHHFGRQADARYGKHDDQQVRVERQAGEQAFRDEARGMRYALGAGEQPGGRVLCGVASFG